MDKEEWINRYFEGTLSKSQLEEFSGLLRTDDDFKKAFEFEQELQIALKKEERKELKRLFSSLNDDQGEKKSNSKVISMPPWLAAASIALIIGLGSWIFYLGNTDINSGQLYLSNFAPYENVVHPIERGNQLEDLLSRAFTAYESEDYNKALELFKELHTKQNDDYLEFYEAIILMQLNRHEESIPLLKDYIQNDGVLKDRAHWYLALAYLKLDKIEDCKTELQKLVQIGSFKKEAGEELLEKLD